MELQPLLHFDLDPGPTDPSVLVWQHEHRSAAIWEDEVPPRELTCRHKLLGMRDWPLDPRVCRYLIEFGLYGVYKVAFIQLDYALITALVERWRPETHTFHLPVGETTITLQDVNILLGLRVDGPALTGSTKYNWADLCEELLGRRPSAKDLHGSHISLGWLRENFRNLPPDADKETLERHTRAFVLALMSGFLYGDKSKHDVALTFLPLLRDFDEVTQLSWGSATLALLYRELCRASKRTVSTICGPLVLLQLWAWERLHVGRPLRLKDVGTSYMEGIDGPLPDPLGCRWRASLSHKENPRGGLDFYRDQFDQQKDDQVIWQPYTPDILEKLPPICFSGQNIWRTVAPLICFDVVEWHRPDRVLRQFGLRQPIPTPCDNEKALHAIDKRGKSEYDWSARHRRHIELWDSRESTVVSGEPENCPMDYHDPYMEWYRQITRKIISPLKERRPGQFQPTGFAVQFLIQRVAVIHGRCKATLDNALTIEGARQTLQEIHDMCTGILQITAPIGSLSNGSPSQAPRPDSFAMLPQNSASDMSMALVAPTSETLDVEIAQVPSSMELAVQSSAGFPTASHGPDETIAITDDALAAPLEVLPPVPGIDPEQSLSSSSQKPLSWPSGGKLTFSWICDVMLSFDWSSRNLPPAEFSTVLPVKIFDDLVLCASKILKKEPNCVKINSNKAKVVVVGDLYGQLHDLLFLMQDAGFPDDDQFYVFNGNYVDKGAWGLESFLLLLAWKVLLPERVFLLRGNNESESCTSTYGFKNEVLTKYGDKGLHVYKKCLDCFQLLPLASLIAGKVFTAHGGLFRSLSEKHERPRKRKRNQKKQTDNNLETEPEIESLPLGSLEELAKARRRVLDPPTEGSNLIPGDILWSNPSNNEGLYVNKERGIGLLWGPDCTKKFLEENELKLIIRGHQGPDARAERDGFAHMDEGYAKDHDGLITLFSAPDYPQFQETDERYNNKGAYIILQIPEFEEPEIHSFEAVTPRPKVEAYYDYKSKVDSDGDSECVINKSVEAPTTAADNKLADSAEKLEQHKSTDFEPMGVDDRDEADSVEQLKSRSDEAISKDPADSVEKLGSGTGTSISSESMEANENHVTDSDDKLGWKTDKAIGSEAMAADDEHVVDAAETLECRTEEAIDSEPMAVDDKHVNDSAQKSESNTEEVKNSEDVSADDEKAAGSPKRLKQTTDKAISFAEKTGCTANKAVDSEPTTAHHEGADSAETPEGTTDNRVIDSAEKPEGTTIKDVGFEPTTADHAGAAADANGPEFTTEKANASAKESECTTDKAIGSRPTVADDKVGVDRQKKLEGATDKAIDYEPKPANEKNEADSLEKLECTSSKAIHSGDADDSAKKLESTAKRENDSEPTAGYTEHATEKSGCTSNNAIDSERSAPDGKDVADSADKSECLSNMVSDSEQMQTDERGVADENLEGGTQNAVGAKPQVADDKDVGEAISGSNFISGSVPMDTNA